MLIFLLSITAYLHLCTVGATGIPYPRRLINTCRSEVVAIRGPCHSVHFTAMIFLDEQGMSSSSIPHMHRLICTRRDHTLSIRSPRHSVHITAMIFVDEQCLTCGGIPHSCRL